MDAKDTASAGMMEIPSPSGGLQEKAKELQNYDWLATFSRELECDSTSNITIPQACKAFMGLSKKFLNVRGMEEVAEAVKMAAMPMVSPVNRLGGDAEEQEELQSFFCLSPEDVESICSIDVLDLPPQTKDLFREKEAVDNYRTLYYTFVLVIRRHGVGLKLIDYYWACCHSQETSIWQWIRDSDTKKKRLKSLKVRTQAYLASTLVQRNPEKLSIRDSDEKEILDLFNS